MNDKSNLYNTEKFKELQMSWYKKLDDSGFKDIERTGKERQKYLNEYSGILSQPLHLIAKKYDSDVYAYYALLRNFSYAAKPLPRNTKKAQKPPKSEQKLTKKTQINTNLHQKPTKSTKTRTINITTSNILSITALQLLNSRPKFRISRIERSILRLRGDGKTIREISQYLKHYYTRAPSTPSPGRHTNPYSVYFVHYRLKRLDSMVKLWVHFERSVEA